MNSLKINAALLKVCVLGICSLVVISLLVFKQVPISANPTPTPINLSDSPEPQIFVANPSRGADIVMSGMKAPLNTITTFTCPPSLTANCELTEKPEYTNLLDFIAAGGDDESHSRRFWLVCS